VQHDPWKIIIQYVNAWKSNLLLSVKTNQSPYSDASLRRNLISDSTFLLLHPVFRRLFTLDSDKLKFNQGSDILNRITIWNNISKYQYWMKLWRGKIQIMVVELKILIHSHDNDRIIQREKTTYKTTHTDVTIRSS
jgi:hypothetical protein